MPRHPTRPGRPPPVDRGTPFVETLPRLALAALVALFGLLALVAGGSTGSAALQVVGVMLLGAGVVGALLSELARKDSAWR